MKVLELESQSLSGLRQLAKSLKVENAHRMKKEDLIMRIRQAEAERDGLELRGGILEIMSEGIGFLRSGHYQPGPYDVYVSQSQIRRYSLRNGDLIIGHVRPPRETERHYGLLRIESVNGIDPEEAKRRPTFESLTPIFPEMRFDLETDRHTSGHADDQPGHSHRARPAWVDRFTAKSRQNDHPETDCQRDLHQQPGNCIDGCPDR